jgi:arylsulfatase A-like enzyme
MRIVRGLLLPVLWLGACAGTGGEAAGGRPNLVFILLDNVGQEWFGCYGSEEGATPAIDALARGGVRFEHCTTHPVCGPSRVMLLTGRYPFRTGWTMHHDAALYSGGGLDPARETVVARLLRDAGYETAIAGKWQVNNLYDEPGVLAKHGFDEHLVWPGSIDRERIGEERTAAFLDSVRRESADEVATANRDIESRYWDPVFLRNGKRERHPGKFGPDVLQDFALDFIRRRRERPFFLYYPMLLTHGPSFLHPTVPTPLNRGRELTEHERFADMLRYADRLVGDLVRTLEESGLREQTVVFLASDNGTEKSLTARRNGRAVRGGLYRLTSAGGSVVLTANAPGRIPGGRTGELADFSDVLPTLCDLAGATRPAGVTLDGRSLAPFLLGREQDVPRRWIFNQYHTRRVVQDRRYKLYSTGELYDFLADPEEARDLTADPSPSTAEARERLRGVLDTLPADDPLPFPVRSISAFQLRAQGLMK